MTISYRIDERTDVVKATTNPPFPKSVKIEVTSRCNYKCMCCASHKGLREHGDMPYGLFSRIVTDCVAAGAEDIGLFLLGEPLVLGNDLGMYVRKAKDAGAKNVFITTNGSLATPQLMYRLWYEGLDSVKFSINADNSGDYSRQTGGHHLEVVMQNLLWLSWWKKWAKKDRPEISVSMIWNEDKIAEMAQFDHSIRPYVDEFYYLPLYNQAGFCEDGCAGNPGRLDNMREPVPCWSLFNQAHITWDGWMTACSFDHDGRFKIADLSKTSVDGAWNHRQFHTLREAHLNGTWSNTVCRECLS